MHLLYSLLSAKTCLSVEFLKHSLSIAQQLRSLVSHRKMKPICVSVDIVSRSTLFFFLFLFYLFVRPGGCCNECMVICAWLQQLLVAMYRKCKER